MSSIIFLYSSYSCHIVGSVSDVFQINSRFSKLVHFSVLDIGRPISGKSVYCGTFVHSLCLTYHLCMD